MHDEGIAPVAKGELEILQFNYGRIDGVVKMRM